MPPLVKIAKPKNTKTTKTVTATAAPSISARESFTPAVSVIASAPSSTLPHSPGASAASVRDAIGLIQMESPATPVTIP